MWAAIRLIRATWVFAWIFASYVLQLGLVRALGRARFRHRWQSVHRRNARRMYHGFIRLRGVYIKLGQILSIMGSFLPRAYSEELEGLQDEVPAQPYEKMARSFRRAFGQSPTEAFASFSRAPIAAASLGQVHEARSKSGERLAVKLLYPNIATIIKIDLRVLGWVLRVYRIFVPVKQLERVHQQLEDLLASDTDLGHEARCLERMAANFADDPDVLFPAVHHEYTCKTVLTMSFMEAVKITRVETLGELALEPRTVATKLVQTFYKQVFIDGFFHADRHPSNFFVQRGPDGRVRVMMLDFGSASEVEDNLAEKTQFENIGLICGADDILGAANPTYAQKIRLIQQIEELPADFVLLDLGAGTSFNTLDLFNFSPGKILVFTSQVTSLQNAYGFVKSALYRKLSRDFSKDEEVLNFLYQMGTKDTEAELHSIKDLLDHLDGSGEQKRQVSEALQQFQLFLLVKMVKSSQDLKSADIIKTVCRDFLSLHPQLLGHLAYDPAVETAVIQMTPFPIFQKKSKAAASLQQIAHEFLMSCRLAPAAATRLETSPAY